MHMKMHAKRISFLFSFFVVCMQVDYNLHKRVVIFALDLKVDKNLVLLGI